MCNIQNFIILKNFDLKLLLKLLIYVNPYKLIFIGAIFTSICFGVFSTTRPLLIQYAFDNYIINYNIHGLLHIIIIIFIFLLLEAFFQFLFIYRSNYLAQKIIQNIRSEVFAKIMRFKVSYFDTIPTC